jgi:hypothetical protein
VDERVEIATLAHDEFLGLVAGAELLLTSPGTTTIIEAAALGVPVRFLPPHNWSQALAAETLQRVLGPSETVALSSCFPGLELSADLQEHEGLALVDHLVDQLMAAGKVEPLVARLLDDPPVNPPKTLSTWLGVDGSNGQQVIVERVAELVDDHGVFPAIAVSGGEPESGSDAP